MDGWSYLIVLENGCMCLENRFLSVRINMFALLVLSFVFSAKMIFIANVLTLSLFWVGHTSIWHYLIWFWGCCLKMPYCFQKQWKGRYNLIFILSEYFRFSGSITWWYIPLKNNENFDIVRFPHEVFPVTLFWSQNVSSSHIFGKQHIPEQRATVRKC